MRALQARGVGQACVSNSGRTIVDANIKALGVAKIIAFSMSLEDVSAGKPDPEPYREAARRLGAEPQGDGRGRGQRRRAPVPRGRRGCYVVGYSPSGEPFVGADRSIAHLIEVAALVRGLRRRRPARLSARPA